MQWEVILVIILAIGVGITIMEAFRKRTIHRRENKAVLFNQHTHDKSKNQPADE